jgi:beta-carotene hydroxylase
MKNPKAALLTVPDAKRDAFKKLTQIPEYSWPCIALAVTVISAVLIIDGLALTDRISLIGACGLLTFVYYWFFSAIHDSVHRSICKNKTLNDWIGRAVIFVFAPYASIHLFRWAHMEHHRFTNDAGDPDVWSHGAWWTLPFRWMTIDFYYAYRALRSDNPQVKKIFSESLPMVGLGLTIITLLVASGHGIEYLLLWFVPTRLAFVFIGYSFFWLPHAHWPDPSHDIRQSNNFTLATTLRLGNEGLFNWLYQYQNYHLIHHLWPTTPFYNNERVWQLLKPELLQRDLAIVKNFEVKPVYHLVD